MKNTFKLNTIWRNDSQNAMKDLLANRNFMLFTLSDFIASFGTNLTLFAIWSQVMTLTGNSPSALGLSTIMEILPGILISPWAGLLADRFSKRRILILSFLLRSVTVGLMFVSTELWHLYVLAAFHSMFGAFGEPPRKAFMPFLVKPEQYVTMNSLFAIMNNVLQMLRPALSGALVWSLGYKAAFAANFFMYLIPILGLLLIRVNERMSDTFGKQTGIRQQVREGVAYIRTEPILIYLFTFMILFTFAMGMQGTLTLLFVGQYLAAPETASSVTGLLFSALGLGGLLGAVMTNTLIKRFSILWLLFAALAFDGAVVIVFALSQTFLVAWICFALFGIIGSVIQIVQDSIIQTIVPEQMRGRVYGAFGPITGPVSLLSIALGTSLAAAIGPRAVFLIAGGLEFGAVLISRLLPSYRQVRDSLQQQFSA